MFLIIILSIFVIILSIIYLYGKKQYTFWQELNVPFLIPKFPIGNLGETLTTKKHFSYILQDLYTKLKYHGDFVGIFAFISPMLLILSPEFTKTILVKDFQYFVDRGVYSNEKIDPLSANLFFIEGDKWKNLRAKITPTFTSGKLKKISLTIFSISEQLISYLEPKANNNEDIEIRDILARFTTDIIGSCAFGFDCNSIEDPNSMFRQMGKKLFHFSKLNALKMFFGMMFRKIAHALNFRMTDKVIADFFMKIIKETIEYREKNNIKRNDFMQLMIQLKNNGELDENEENINKNENKIKEKLTFNEIAAQAYVFFIAGFDTSATTMTFVFHELARNLDIQERLRAEIRMVLDKYSGVFTYEGIQDMEYLDRVIQETLRLYPPVASLHRISTKDYELPNGSIIPTGTSVLISTIGFHRDPEYFPDPLKFDPDRFTEENKLTRHNFTHIPFGEGPRICIGMRFGMLQTKIGIAMLLHNYIFNICEKSIHPIEIDPVAMLHVPKGDVWLNMSKV